MKRQEHFAEVEEVAIRVRVENLKNGRYLGTSPDVPGLVAEGRSVAETVEIAQGLARKNRDRGTGDRRDVSYNFSNP